MTRHTYGEVQQCCPRVVLGPPRIEPQLRSRDLPPPASSFTSMGFSFSFIKRYASSHSCCGGSVGDI